VSVLRSRDNPRVKRWSRLVRDRHFRRKEARAIIEGPHLLAALLEKGLKPLAILATEEGLEDREIRRLIGRASPVLLSAGLFRAIVDAENPPGVAAEIAIPEKSPEPDADCVFLEGVQDAGNVGAIVRSAAAFGVGAVCLDRGCADAWSPKVLRAAMGGHFHVSLVQKDFLQDLSGFDRLICTVPTDGTALDKADLSGRLGWIFGAEGRGVSKKLKERASLRVTIPMARGSESLNVAAAAAICLHEAFSRRAAGS